MGRFMCGLFSLSLFDACWRIIFALSDVSLKFGSGAPHTETNRFNQVFYFFEMKISNFEVQTSLGALGTVLGILDEIEPSHRKRFVNLKHFCTASIYFVR